jgi:hypothetical protein
MMMEMEISDSEYLNKVHFRNGENGKYINNANDEYIFN